MKQLDIYSQKAVCDTATMKVTYLRKIIGMLNKLSGQEYRQGVIDPRTRERISKAFKDLNRWRAVKHWVVKNLYVFVRCGLPTLALLLGLSAEKPSHGLKGGAPYGGFEVG